MKTLYQCEVCKATYVSKCKALECEASTGKPKFEVGDIVFARSGFRWYDGDKKWISNPGVLEKKNSDHGYEFYFVVTHIDGDPYDRHRVRYHLATDAMTEESGYRTGYTFDNGDHYTPRKIKSPPERIVEASKELIGLEAEALL